MTTNKRATKKQERRQLILDEAEALMREKGLEALNMDELAKESKGVANESRST